MVSNDNLKKVKLVMKKDEHNRFLVAARHSFIFGMCTLDVITISFACFSCRCCYVLFL